MSAYIIKPDASLGLVLEEAVITLARLKAYAFTSPLASDYEAFLKTCMSVTTEDIQITIALLTAHATAFVVDSDLNDLSDATAKILDVITHGDRTDAEFAAYFGNQRPSDFKRPQLAEQLDAMRQWPRQMQGSPYPPLIEMGAQVAVKVAEARSAVEALEIAEQNNVVFRTTGSRRQLIDAFNALRKSTYGKLAEMPHAQPQLKLPNNFADRFFRPERSPSAAKPRTVEEIEAKLKEAQKEVEELQEQLDKAKKARADSDAAKAKAQRSLDQQELDKILAEQAKLAAKKAALKAKLGEKKPGTTESGGAPAD